MFGQSPTALQNRRLGIDKTTILHIIKPTQKSLGNLTRNASDRGRWVYIPFEHLVLSVCAGRYFDPWKARGTVHVFIVIWGHDETLFVYVAG
jgi:hypothetical protein